MYTFRTHIHTSCYVTTGSSEVHTSAACVCVCVRALKKYGPVSGAATPLQTPPLALSAAAHHKHKLCGFEYIKNHVCVSMWRICISHLSPLLSEPAQSLVMRIRRGHVNAALGNSQQAGKCRQLFLPASWENGQKAAVSSRPVSSLR